MKAKFMFIIALFLLAFSSCKDCTVCTKSGDPDVRYCEKDFDSNTAYALAVDIKEADGYNCRGDM